jgi:Pyruvate/2-oxoacid:ferredoxin oxidoreductase delta subunit
MCEFCLKHGEGKKWYLQAANYSEDLLSDIRRRRFIENFLTKTDQLSDSIRKLETLAKAPVIIKSIVGRLITRKMKKDHFGQVVPIEDIERIFEFVNSVARVPCVCRLTTLGEDKRYCYGISIAPDGGKFGQIIRGLDKSFLGGPDNLALEQLTKEQALADIRDHEKEGLCHTVWTFGTPFIAGICNCDRADCLAMRCTVTHQIPVMFPAEYITSVDSDLCTGCRQCMRLCQFGAISYSAANKKIVIDKARCYGCGICRSLCPENAIGLQDRKWN